MIRRATIRDAIKYTAALALNLDRRLTWLASYPRSGNTWLRYLINDAFFFPRYPDQEDGERFRRTIPDLHKGYDIVRRPLLPFAKTHASRLPGMGNVVVLVRDPVDVIWSYYRRSRAKADDTRTIEEFAKHQFSGLGPYRRWDVHIRSYVHAVEHSHVLFIRYEDMLQNPARALQAVLEFSGYTVTHALSVGLQESVDRNSLWDSETVSVLARQYGKGYRNLPSDVKSMVIDEYGATAEMLGYSLHKQSISDQIPLSGKISFFKP